MRLALWAAAALLAACAAERPALRLAPPPPEPVLYTALPAGHTGYDNASLAELFVRLTLETEWGGRRARLARFEGPVTVAIEGEGAARHRPFLAEALAYIRRHTGLAIGPGSAGAAITVRLVPGGEFAAALPAASCIVVPGDTPWRAFLAAPEALGGEAMVAQERLEAATVYIPASAIPADIRRCILEEVTQALGPVNDLYGLGPSVFNDDFGHLWPTRLDLLMLRVLYDPALETGLDAEEAERRARAVLARINPAGAVAEPLPPYTHRTAAAWLEILEPALRADRSAEERREAALVALDFARGTMALTPWHCTSLTVAGQLAKRADPRFAAAALARADEVCARAHGAEDPRIWQIRLMRAGLALAEGDPRTALALTEGLDTRLAAHGLDEALAAGYAIRARAHALRGDSAAARRQRALAEGWKAYALGRPQAD